MVTDETLRSRPPSPGWPGLPPDDPAVLMARVAGGDREAYAMLYDQMAPRVYGLARAVVRDAAFAEEVTQEVMLAMWQTAWRYDPARGSPRTWMLTMAHRRAVDRVRSEQSARDRNDRYATARAARAFDEVAEAVETRLEHHEIAAALHGLSALQRQSVELAYYGGYTYREVAELLDIPLGTVKTRIREGLVALRARLPTTTLT